MPSDFTDRNRYELQEPGENTNTWGDVLNALLELLDASQDGFASYALSGTKTLTSANNSDDEARKRLQIIASGTGGTVTIPSVEKNYIFWNKATGNVTVTTGAGRTATLLPSSFNIVICDATNVDLANPTKTSQIPSDANDITNKTYVDGAILAAVLGGGELPGQSGKTGPLFTNGTTADFRQILTSDVLNLDTLLVPDVQEFTASGTWTKPSNATVVLVEAWGAGGGGGSGSLVATGSESSGGGGGGGGAMHRAFYDASDLGATVAITIGAGGSGGASVSTSNTDGNNGANGGSTAFGSHLVCGGGDQGLKGLFGQGLGGAGGAANGFSVEGWAGGQSGGIGNFTGGPSAYGGGGGGSGRVTGSNLGDQGYAGGGSVYGGGGGGGGGGHTNTTGGFNGGAGGSQTASTGGGGSAGVKDTSAGGAGPAFCGGGGGGSATSGSGRNGGAGGLAGGGGGGGCGINGSTSGAGGTGGGGFVRVTTWR